MVSFLIVFIFFVVGGRSKINSIGGFLIDFKREDGV